MDLLIHDGAGSDAAGNLALEEALARAAPSRLVLRLWQNGRCVVLGRAQRPEREANLAACAAGDVPVLRRSSGGGAVYQDLGNLNITLAAPGAAPGLAAVLAGLIVDVLAGLGLPAWVGDRGVHVGPADGPSRGPADGPVDRPEARPAAGRAKVSGLASQVTKRGTVAHATLLVTTPAAAVVAHLAPAPADHRPTDSRRSPVVALRDLLPGITVADARSAVLAEASRAYGRPSPRPPDDPERRWQERLLAERYRSDSWHLTGRTKETQWMTRPALTSTG